MDILSDKIVKTRKARCCDACYRKFPKGTQMRRQVNTYDGIGTWYECPTCQDLLLNYYSYFADNNYGEVESGCVAESLERDETPQDLLKRLRNGHTF